MQENNIRKLIRKTKPKVHCITNYVTMQDVANVLLAVGGSGIMAQDAEETAEITSFCHATLLNTGTPDREKIRACINAGIRANELNHPVILDPVGIGASAFRRELLLDLCSKVRFSVIRCNQEEAKVLLELKEIRHCTPEPMPVPGGVESSLHLTDSEAVKLAETVAKTYACVVLISGKSDVVSDGTSTRLLTGGDARIRRITGGGCMQSALCALFCGAIYASEETISAEHSLYTDRNAVNADQGSFEKSFNKTPCTLFDAVYEAGKIWKSCVKSAGQSCAEAGAGIGTFHMKLFDELEELMKEEQG